MVFGVRIPRYCWWLLKKSQTTTVWMVLKKNLVKIMGSTTNLNFNWLAGFTNLNWLYSRISSYQQYMDLLPRQVRSETHPGGTPGSPVPTTSERFHWPSLPPSRWRSSVLPGGSRSQAVFFFVKVCEGFQIHPGRLTWNLQITHLERNMIFQTSMIMFHVNLQGCRIHVMMVLYGSFQK